MEISLTKPELEQFIQEQIREGHFSTPTDVVEAAVARLMDAQADIEFDEETLAAIKRADEQLERGEGIDIAAAAAHLRRKHLGR